MRSRLLTLSVHGMLITSFVLFGCGRSTDDLGQRTSQSGPTENNGVAEQARPEPEAIAAATTNSNAAGQKIATKVPTEVSAGASNEVPAVVPPNPSTTAQPKKVANRDFEGLGDFVSPDGFEPYRIRPPAGYRSRTSVDKDFGKVFQWMGNNYKVASGIVTYPFLAVTVRKEPSAQITAEQEMQRRLKALAAVRSDWRPSEIRSGQLNGITFLHCSFTFSDSPIGPSEGFLFVSVDGDSVIHLFSAGSGEHAKDLLKLSYRSAQSIERRTDLPAVSLATIPTVDRWKTFEPLEEPRVEFQPLPLDPEPPPGPEDKAQMATEDRLVQQALEKARAEDLGVFVRVEAMPDGSMKGLINAGATTESRTNWTQEQSLTFGNGIPLFPLDAAWTAERPADAGQKPVPSAEETHYRFYTHNLLGDSRPDFRGAIRRLLWSEDGNDVFILTTEGHLLKVDVNEWRVVAAIRPQRAIQDIAFSSQGLIALHFDSDSSSGKAPTRPWVMLEPGSTYEYDFEASRLLVLDAETLEIRRAYRLAGDAVVGNCERDLVYVQQLKLGRLLVVNIANGELVNVIDASSLKPREVVAYKGSQTRSRTPRASFDKLRLTRGGRTLISIEDRNGGFALNRFQLTGPHLVCTMSVNNLPKSRGPIRVSEDGRFLVFPLQARKSYPSVASVGWLQIIRTEDFDESVGDVPYLNALGAYAVDPMSKSIVLLESVATAPAEGGREMQLRILQDKIDVKVPMGEEEVDSIWPHPQGRGVLLFTDVASHWLEFKTRGERWCFERDAPNVLPAVACDIRPVRPETPIEAAKTRHNNRLELPIDATWIAWAPDGSAYYGLNRRGSTVHRFDAAANRETHRLQISNGNGDPASDSGSQGGTASAPRISRRGTIVPRVFMTKDGILLDHRSLKKLFLLDMDTLQPIWELDSEYAEWPVGHRNHGLVAARHKGGLLVFEAKTARVRARGSFFDIAKQWPEWCDNQVAFVFSDPDPAFVACYRDRIATFALEGSKIKFVKSGGRNYGTMPKFETPEPPYEPDGFKYEPDERTKQLTVVDPNGRKAFTLRHGLSVSHVAPHPVDRNRVLFSAKGKMHILTLNLPAPSE